MKFEIGQTVERRETIHGYVRFKRGTVIELTDRVRVLWQLYRVATYNGKPLEGGEEFRPQRKPVRTWNKPDSLNAVA